MTRMDGKTCLVTGATSGIGYETALGLARLGARVIGVGRSAQRCAASRESIRAATGVEPAFETVDLASGNGIRELGARLRGSCASLDVIVNNAGAFTMHRRVSSDGIELQMAVNFLAPFHLTHTVWPLLEKSADARVVTLSSGTHLGARLSWLDTERVGPYLGLRAYSATKLACVLFTYELARRVGAGSRITTYAVDPGLVYTDMGLKDSGPLARLVWRVRRKNGRTPEEGARTSVYLSSDPAAPRDTGRYWKDCAPIPSSAVSHDPRAAERLWALAERLCSIPEGSFGKP